MQEFSLRDIVEPPLQVHAGPPKKQSKLPLRMFNSAGAELLLPVVRAW